MDKAQLNKQELFNTFQGGLSMHEALMQTASSASSAGAQAQANPESSKDPSSSKGEEKGAKAGADPKTLSQMPKGRETTLKGNNPHTKLNQSKSSEKSTSTPANQKSVRHEKLSPQKQAMLFVNDPKNQVLFLPKGQAQHTFKQAPKTFQNLAKELNPKGAEIFSNTKTVKDPKEAQKPHLTQDPKQIEKTNTFKDVEPKKPSLNSETTKAKTPEEQKALNKNIETKLNNAKPANSAEVLANAQSQALRPQQKGKTNESEFFALLNASRGNEKAREEEHKKKSKVHSASDVKKKKPEDAEAAANQDQTTTNSPSKTEDPSDGSSGVHPTPAPDPEPPFVYRLMHASCWDMNYALICTSLMLAVGMAPQTEQLNDIMAIVSAAQRVMNDVNGLLSWTSNIENDATQNGGLSSSFFSQPSNISALEKAAQSAADLFFSNPANRPLKDYEVTYQGVTYVPVVVISESGNKGEDTFSIAWENVNDVSSAQLNQSASDLQVLMCSMFQYEADIHIGNNIPNSTKTFPSASSLQEQISQSLSGIMGLITFTSTNTYNGFGFLEYLVTIGGMVNFMQSHTLANASSGTVSMPYFYTHGAYGTRQTLYFKSVQRSGFKTVSPSGINDIGIFNWGEQSGSVPYTNWFNNFTGMIRSWAASYAKAIDMSNSGAYGQPTKLGDWDNALNQVVSSGGTKVQQASSKAKLNTTNISDMQQICQSVIKGYTQFQQDVVSNYKSA